MNPPSFSSSYLLRYDKDGNLIEEWVLSGHGSLKSKLKKLRNNPEKLAHLEARVEILKAEREKKRLARIALFNENGIV